MGTLWIVAIAVAVVLSALMGRKMSQNWNSRATALPVDNEKQQNDLRAGIEELDVRLTRLESEAVLARTAARVFYNDQKT
jgi:hypothetical protein